VLERSTDVQEQIEEAAADLANVNNVITADIRGGTPLAVVVGALDQSLGAESKVQDAVKELVAVNDAFANVIETREQIERQLARSQIALHASRVHERRARHDALHDSITGLPNLALFKDRLERALVQAHRHEWKCAVMFLDLDRFKQVNDTHGHDVGDSILRLVADRLRAFVRDGDTVGRRSGDEFLYLMTEPTDRATVEVMATRLAAMLAEPATIGTVTLSVSVSVGVAVYPDDASTAVELLTKADHAMYDHKRRAGPEHA
jgi:diguanylate cyclase (GGDEF)-like protein